MISPIQGYGWNVHALQIPSFNSVALGGLGSWVRIDASTLTPAQVAPIVAYYAGLSFKTVVLVGQEGGSVTAATVVGRVRDIMIACLASPPDALELYNEMDSIDGNAITPARAADDYQRIFQTAFVGLHRPYLLGGGMAGWDSRGGGNVPNWFVDWVAANGHLWVDGIAMHAYWINADVGADNLATSLLIAAAQIAAYVGEMDIYWTERGFQQSEVESRSGTSWDATTAAGYYHLQGSLAVDNGMPFCFYDTYGGLDTDIETLDSGYAAKQLLVDLNSFIVEAGQQP